MDSSEKYAKKAFQKKWRRRRRITFGTLLFSFGFLLGTLTAYMLEKPQEIIYVPAVSPHSKEALPEKAETKTTELPWNLQLVNFQNYLPYYFEPENMKKLPNGDKIDGRILEDAKKMINDAKADGVHILCASGYRSFDRQKKLHDNKVKRLQKEKKYSLVKAREEAAKEVAIPGTSEHQLGLALDLTDASYTGLDKKQETTAAYKWLKKHCHEYGFIVRYPAGKTDITGIIYEPWHFRYVGMEAAAEIMEKGITLEEYLGCSPI